MVQQATRMPTLYLPHGGGPCFFMDWTMGPADTWQRMGQYLSGLGRGLGAVPQALLVISAHWEEAVPTVIDSERPPLLYDYYGFPAHTYELTWPAPGSPELAARVRELLGAAGLASARTAERGIDHGVFIPLKLAFPEAQLPTVQLSLVRGLDPETHLTIGRALSPLRDEGVFVVGSGMSFHNMGALMGRVRGIDGEAFDRFLVEAAAAPAPERALRLRGWERAQGARQSHPREEHLLPLMVVAGAAEDDRGAQVYSDRVMGAAISAFQFG